MNLIAGIYVSNNIQGHKKDDMICHGVLVGTGHLLTTASCVKGINSSDLVYDFPYSSKDYHDRENKVNEIFPHFMYKESGFESNEFNLAILKIDVTGNRDYSSPAIDYTLTRYPEDINSDKKISGKLTITNPEDMHGKVMDAEITTGPEFKDCLYCIDYKLDVGENLVNGAGFFLKEYISNDKAGYYLLGMANVKKTKLISKGLDSNQGSFIDLRKFKKWMDYVIEHGQSPKKLVGRFANYEAEAKKLRLKNFSAMNSFITNLKKECNEYL
ncbi:hypothetical protein AYI68_g4678 [Smittium mucronatum]|uniref:Peptidase S1 domain-containing protein n=1 Tax=Smittium mucronatum TaxID=133383 RepID=A0A1R0GWE6_9FUNG|nr:hypothetical protein AYI68_g4678 [Smittium mucronatum]